MYQFLKVRENSNWFHSFIPSVDIYWVLSINTCGHWATGWVASDELNRYYPCPYGAHIKVTM